MFKENMIAPCGLNCSICSQALRKENPCTGCLGPNDTKSEYCATMCKIAACDIRKTLPDYFCDQYPMVESLMGNLALIRKEGMQKFLQLEEDRWKCHKCNGIICVHTGICSDCGEEYTIRSNKR